METDSSLRYATAKELADDLHRFLDNKPICRQPIQTGQRLARWVFRHRLLAGMVLLMAIVWLVAAQLIAVYAFRARDVALRESSALLAEREYNKASIALLSESLSRDAKGNSANFNEPMPEIPAHIRAFYQRALLAREKLAHENPKSTDYLLDVAATRASFGVLLSQRGDLDAACDEMLEVLKIIHTVNGPQREDSTYMQSNTENECRRMASSVLRTAGRFTEALPFARPLGMAIGDDGVLYVSSRGLDSVLIVNLANGNLLGELRLPDGTLSPHGVAIGTDGRLYVSSEEMNRIVRFDCSSGGFSGTVIDDVPHPVGIAFGPNGNLYVACSEINEIRQYNVDSGALISVFGTGDSDRLRGPTGLVFGAGGLMYVACAETHRIECYVTSTGEFRGVFASDGGLRTPIYLTFGPDGDLYVVGRDSGAVHRYHGRTGAFVEVVASTPKLHLPEGLAFTPSGDLYVNTTTDAVILRINAKTGTSHRVLR
jgi:sugar lactone lactonase YvrE